MPGRCRSGFLFATGRPALVLIVPWVPAGRWTASWNSAALGTVRQPAQLIRTGLITALLRGPVSWSGAVCPRLSLSAALAALSLKTSGGPSVSGKASRSRCRTRLGGPDFSPRGPFVYRSWPASYASTSSAPFNRRTVPVARFYSRGVGGWISGDASGAFSRRSSSVAALFAVFLADVGPRAGGGRYSFTSRSIASTLRAIWRCRSPMSGTPCRQSAAVAVSGWRRILPLGGRGPDPARFCIRRRRRSVRYRPTRSAPPRPGVRTLRR